MPVRRRTSSKPASPAATLATDSGIHLERVALRREKLGTGHPFAVPAVQSLDSIAFSSRVTFFVGENGSGKSTLLEGIAAAARLPTVGSDSTERDATLDAARALATALRLTWSVRATRGFFLRAEDFFGFAKQLSAMRVEMEQRIAELKEEYRAQDRSDYALGLASGPMRASIAEMEHRYGRNLDANSHGQSFLLLFKSRFVPGGLYLLDEPEAPLSPQSQLALIAMMHEMIGQQSQFIIATHSPILLAYPGARIITFDRTPVEEVAYANLEHVNLTREFLNDPERYLRRLT
jgi:predicted ATPase